MNYEAQKKCDGVRQSAGAALRTALFGLLFYERHGRRYVVFHGLFIGGGSGVGLLLAPLSQIGLLTAILSVEEQTSMWRIGLLLAILLQVQSGQAETQRVEGLEFEQVLVYGNTEVEITQGEQAGLLVRGSSSKLEKEPFYVDGDTLVLGRSKRHRRAGFSSVQFKLTVAEITHLQLKGSGDIYVKPLVLDRLYVSIEGSGGIKLFELDVPDLTMQMSGSGDLLAARVATDALRMVQSGSGDLHLGELHASTVKISLSGSGDMSIRESGSSDSLEINIVGSGDVDLEALESLEASVNIAGSGTATLSVADTLDVNIMGSGDVFYRGDPQLHQSVLGSGESRRID